MLEPATQVLEVLWELIDGMIRSSYCPLRGIYNDVIGVLVGTAGSLVYYLLKAVDFSLAFLHGVESMYTRTYTYAYAHAHTHMHTHAHTHEHTNLHTPTHAHHAQHIQTCTYKSAHTNTCTSHTTQADQVTQEVSIDHRIHSRLIGARGKSINKVMEKFNVDIRFPRDKESDVVMISGLEENVEDAKDHILNLAEDYVSLVCMWMCL